jgi:hypothetical protein
MVKEEIKVDVMMLQEPWVVGGRVAGLRSIGTIFALDTKGPRACVILRKGLNGWFLPQFSSRDTAAVLVQLPGEGQAVFASVYMADDGETNIPSEEVERLVEYCARKTLPLVLGADANAHHVLWGSTDTNKRGEDLLGFLAASHLEVCNVGNDPTFVTRNRREVLDVTLVSTRHVDQITSWKVHPEDAASDHRMICFSFATKEAPRNKDKVTRRTNWSKYESTLFRKLAKAREIEVRDVSDLEVLTDEITKAVKLSFRNSSKETRTPEDGSQPWWSPELKSLQAAFRRASRRAYATGLTEDEERRKQARRDFKRACGKAKGDKWREYCENMERAAPVARLVKAMKSDTKTQVGMMKKPCGEYTETPEEAIDALLEAHFPGKPEEGRSRGDEHSPMMAGLVEAIVTKRKVIEAINGFEPNKAPGPDGVSPVLLQKGGKALTDELVKLFRGCLAMGYVPRAWRESRIAFLPKPGKERYDMVSSFRPVSLMSFLLKTLED